MVPFVFSLGFDGYSSSILGDNCLWTYYNYHTLLYKTRYTKQIKSCEYNLEKFVDQADDVLDIFN